VGLTGDAFFAFRFLMHCKKIALACVYNYRRKTGITIRNQGSVGEMEKSKQAK
jgi:hypothetical protein